MRYLLDTNIVSQLIKPSPSANVMRWLGQIGDVDLAMSAITVRELIYGVEKARRERAAAVDAYADRIEAVIASYEGRVLPIDARVARTWAAMLARSNKHVDDTGLAATAAVHGLRVPTQTSASFLTPLSRTAQEAKHSFPWVPSRW